MPEKGSRHRPWFPFYAGDFAATTRTWSTEEIGCYVLLLIEQWINGEVPHLSTDATSIAQALQRIHPDIPKHWDTKLKKKFPNGKNPRLDEIRTDMLERCKTLSSRGHKGATARWGEKKNATSMTQAFQQASPKHDASIPTGNASGNASGNAQAMPPTPIGNNKEKRKRKKKGNVITDSMWKTFSDLYPNRDGPDSNDNENPNPPARQRAEKLIATGTEWADIMTGLRRYRQYCDDNKLTGSKYIRRKENFLLLSKQFWLDQYPDATSTDSTHSLAKLLGITQRPAETEQQFSGRVTAINNKRIADLGK